MKRIELFTSGGDFVAVVEIHPFPAGHEPDVVMWGSRTFTKRDAGTYVEAFVMMSLTPSPGFDKDGKAPWKVCQFSNCEQPVVYGSARCARHQPDSNSGPPAEPKKAKPRHTFGDPFDRIPDPNAVPPVDRSAVTTLHGSTPELVREQHAKQPVGMHADYIVLTDAERAKGFVRPVRNSYKHVGIAGPKNPLRDLTTEEKLNGSGYAKYEAYPERDGSSVTGMFWTQARLDAVGKGCGTVTRMGDALSETYARDPRFYGATFCCGCNRHLPVGEVGEFVWDGTDERVGT